MDFDKLYRPYATKEAPTYVDILPWLERNGIPKDIADQAIIKTFADLEQGLTLEPDAKHTATWNLWMYARKIADEMQRDELKNRGLELQLFSDRLKREMYDEASGLLKRLATLTMPGGGTRGINSLGDAMPFWTRLKAAWAILWGKL